jgi:hypothetical protein
MDRIVLVRGNEPAVACHVRRQDDCQGSSHDLTGRQPVFALRLAARGRPMGRRR